MLNVVEITATAAALTIPAFVKGVVLVGGSDASTIALSNGAAGTDPVKIRGTAAANITTPIMFTEAVKFGTAVYATLTGTGAKAYIYYK